VARPEILAEARAPIRALEAGAEAILEVAQVRVHRFEIDG
jgi:hypothetical protein